MLVLLPQAAVVSELLGDDRIHVNVLGDVIVVFGGILEGGRAVGRYPDGRMGLLVGFGSGQGLVKLPGGRTFLSREGLEKARLYDASTRPGHQG
jgi:hypothetical protein